MLRSSNRAQDIIEAVLSGFDMGGRDELHTAMQAVYRHLVTWSANPMHQVILLAKAIHNEPLIRALGINISAQKYPDKYTLFTGASTSAETGQVTLYLNPNFVFSNEKSLLQHVGILQSLIQHELTHRGQFVRRLSSPSMSTHADDIKSAKGTQNVAWDMPLRDYRQQIGREHGAQLIRALPVGIPNAQRTVADWYHGQPEEIMGWAVGIGSLLAQVNRKKLLYNTPPGLRLLNQVATIIQNLGHSDESPAMKRFKKSLLEYLVSHENYAPHIAAQEITKIFQYVRAHI